MSILSRLADGFDVQLDSVVKHVEITKKEGKGYAGVRVTDTRGNEFSADRVCATPPLVCMCLFYQLGSTKVPPVLPSL